MAIELVHLTSVDFEEQIDFINLVFSQAHNPHDFVNLMPPVCRPEEEYMRMNLAIKRDGRIRANVLSSRKDVAVAGHALKFAGIGNVSTHVKETGNGLMKMLMNRAIEEMQQEGIDLSSLGGLRQRYRYYGYDHCGVRYSYTLTARNVRHTKYNVPNWHFERITPETVDWIEQAMAFYRQQPLWCLRGDDGTDDFYRHMICWFQEPWACLDESGKMIGYICVSKDGRGSSELLAGSEEQRVDVMAAWIQTRGVDGLTMVVHPWEVTTMRTLDRICESVSIGADHQYRIFNWDRVVHAFMDLKKTYTPLMDGELVLDIEGWGKLAVTVVDGEARCEKTGKCADLTLGSFEAMRVVFGPIPAGYIADLPASKSALILNWFPLPLSWWGQDDV